MSLQFFLTPVRAQFLLVLLVGVTGGIVAGVVHGLYVSNWLLPFWNSLTDAQGAILAQLIFFLAAAWASVLVPLLFGERLRNLEAAAEAAQQTFDEIKGRLEESAEESKRQFKSISRYQQMALGYFANDGLLSQLESPEDKKEFIDNAWEHVEPKLREALLRLHGHTQNSIRSVRSRTAPWWERVKASAALRDYYSDFKAISDRKWEVAYGTPAAFEQLKSVNDALKRIREFDPSEEVSAGNGAAAATPTGPDLASLPPSTPEQGQHPN